MTALRRFELSFFTAIVLEWKYLLTDDRYKDIIVDSLKHLVSTKEICLHAFVIMNNHMHVLWHVINDNKADVQRNFLKFTAQMIIKDLRDHNPELLKEFYVGTRDRKYQIWERNSLTIDIWNEAVLKQKLDYVHNNPVKANLCVYGDDYVYSSASFYNGGEDRFSFLTSCF